MTARTSQQGISLVETMVGMAVGLIASIVIVQSFSSSETFRRNISGSADAIQTGAIAGDRLDMLIQEAGASLVQGKHLWGCRLMVTLAGTQILPKKDKYPAPFAGLPSIVRVLPAGIVDGGDSGSDAVVIMIGNSATGNQGMPLSVVVDPSTMSVSNNNGVGLNKALPDDLFLVAPQELAGNPGDCQIVQVAKTFSNGMATMDTSLGLNVMPNVVSGGASLTSINLNVASYGALTSTANSPSAFHLGGAASPIFSALGVNSDGELVELDLLERRAAQTFGENIFLMKARYGLAAVNSNVITEWVAPTNGGKPISDWSIESLMDGTYATEQKINRIKAIRVVLVMRSSQYVSSDSNPSSLTLFADLGSTLQVSRALSTAEQQYQYQVFDWVIPLRNMKVP